jgi:putative MFS transporter
MANGVGRTGGIFMPWICLALAKQELFLPFLLFSSMAFFMAFFDCFLPFDTTGQALDINDHN